MRWRAPVVMLALGLSTSVWAGDPDPLRHLLIGNVNLNAPRALERLEASNPRHYSKVMAILDGLTGRSYSEVPRWIRTNFDANDVTYSSILLTTYPPLRDLGFTIDDIEYYGRVSLAPEGALVLSRTVR